MKLRLIGKFLICGMGLVGAINVSAGPSVKPSKYNLANFIEPRSGTYEGKELFELGKGMRETNKVITDTPLNNGNGVFISKTYSNVHARKGPGSFYSEGQTSEYYNFMDIDGKTYRILHSKKVQESKMALLKEDQATLASPDRGTSTLSVDGSIWENGNVLIRVNSGPKGENRWKEILVKADNFPAGSKPIGYTTNEDVTKVSVQVLEGRKVKEYTFKVFTGVENQQLVGNDKVGPVYVLPKRITRTAIKEIPLSDFYAGDVQPRAAVPAGGGVKGMETSGAGGTK